jgi:hypothetical protein
MRPIAREFELAHAAEHVERLRAAALPTPPMRLRLGKALVRTGFRLAPELRAARPSS